MSNVLASGVSGAFCCSGGRKHALKLTRITRFGRLELNCFCFFVILVGSPKAWLIDGCSNKDAGKVERETPTLVVNLTGAIQSPFDPRDKGHQDPAKIDFTVPRRAQYLHSAWKKHQDAVFWVDINLAIQKRIDILSDSIECNHLSRNTSSLLHSKSCQIEDWRSLI